MKFNQINWVVIWEELYHWSSDTKEGAKFNSIYTGQAVFTTMSSIGWKIYFLEDHLDRLLDNALVLDIIDTKKIKYLRKELEELIFRLNRKVYNLYSIDMEIKVYLSKNFFNNEVIYNIFFLKYPNIFRKFFKKWIKLKVVKMKRLIPETKNVCFLVSYLAQKEAIQSWFDDALFVENDWRIKEWTTSNVFFSVKNLRGDNVRIITPNRDILFWVTRKKVISLLKEEGFQVEERDVYLDEIKKYLSCSDYEVSSFITWTTKTVIPVKNIDNLKFDLKFSKFVRDLLRKKYWDLEKIKI